MIPAQPKKEVEPTIVKKNDAVEVSSISDADSDSEKEKQANKEALREIIKKEKLARMLEAKNTGIEKDQKKKIGRA